MQYTLCLLLLCCITITHARQRVIHHHHTYDRWHTIDGQTYENHTEHDYDIVPASAVYTEQEHTHHHTSQHVHDKHVDKCTDHSTRITHHLTVHSDIHHHESAPTQDHTLPLLYHHKQCDLPDVSDLPIYGLCYHSPLAHDINCPTPHETYTELYQVRRYTQRIRLYSMQQCNVVDILRAAQHFNMTVLLTMYVTTQNEWNTNTSDLAFGMEKGALLRLLDTEHQLVKDTVSGVLVGSEAMLRSEVSATMLSAYVIDIQTTLWYKHYPWLQVSSADAYSAYTDVNRHEAKKLLNTVDFVAVHIYPYYEGIDIDDAIQHIDTSIKHLRKLMNNDRRRIVITETGWPSDGQSNGDAVPSPNNLYQYYREFVCYARKHSVEYYFFEAFDESWKSRNNAADRLGTEGHFGVLNENSGGLKWPFDTLSVTC